MRSRVINPSVHVEIAPLQSQQLAQTHTSADHTVEQGVIAGMPMLDGLKQRGDFHAAIGINTSSLADLWEELSRLERHIYLYHSVFGRAPDGLTGTAIKYFYTSIRCNRLA